jgi:SAM-dependent methyltransferase
MDTTNPAISPTPNKCPLSESVQRARNHYQDKNIAKRFASTAMDTPTDRREKKCVEKALAAADIIAGAFVLDCPCGAGRLLPLLKKHAFKVTGADVSASMVEEARKYAGSQGQNCLDECDELTVSDVFDTGFEDKRFDAVICHRLFQYFSEPQERRLALKELGRISRGPIIVSFLCNWSIDAIGYNIRRAFGLTRKRSCKPISVTTFAKDIRASGLAVEQWIAMRPFISKRWYAVLRPATAHCTVIDRIGAYKNIIWAALGRLAVPAAATLGTLLI